MAGKRPSAPRMAATVAIIRDAPESPEVLMLRRHSRAVFASHYVFPGGVLEPADNSVARRYRGVSAEQADAAIGVEGGQDYYGAAIREAFEESSVLFARTNDGEWAFADDTVSDADIEVWRNRMNDGTLEWDDFLQEHDLYPALDALHYISYWVTPPPQKKRFSTRFFLAVLPSGQNAVHDNVELTDSCWMTARDALAAGKRGEIKLMYPTWSTLRDIAAQPTLDAILAWARERESSGEAQQLPAFVEIDGKDQVVMPGHPQYPTLFDT